MAIRLYEGKIEFDFDSTDGSVKKTHELFIESDGLYFNGKITGTRSEGNTGGVIIDANLAPLTSGASTGDFEIFPDFMTLGTNRLFSDSNGDAVVFTGVIGATLDSTLVANTPPMRGENIGISAGGRLQPYPFVLRNNYETFPFAISSGTFTNTGSMSAQARYNSSSLSSTTHHYIMAGSVPLNPPSPVNAKKIDKYAPNNASATTGVANLINFPSNGNGALATRDDGFLPHSADDIEKFPFASESSISDVGSAAYTRYYTAGVANPTDGFICGGYSYPVVYRDIQKYPFAISSGTATDVGDLAHPAAPSLYGSRYSAAGVSAPNDGFIVGGSSSLFALSLQPDIYKFPYAISSANATDIGSLATLQYNGRSSTSPSDGFIHGRSYPGNAAINTKFPFAISSGTTTDTGAPNHTVDVHTGGQA